MEDNKQTLYKKYLKNIYVNDHSNNGLENFFKSAIFIVIDSKIGLLIPSIFCDNVSIKPFNWESFSIIRTPESPSPLDGINNWQQKA